ncbi:MAG: hypothetical protein DHS20C15_08420 [Planctomycetota bacterium]|nr:MAG: hypothetical protein DHS20C15_08420 [Planctomycetota bacterium]
MALALVLGLFACGEPPSEADEPLNLLLVTLDTTRADQLGLYGWIAPTSPNLDALGAGGVVFERAYAPMGQTFPTHSTILSGLGPREHGVLENHSLLGERVATIAQTLRAKGWDTAGCIGAKVLSERTGIARGFDHWDERMPEREEGRATAERPAEQVADALIAWWDARAESASGSKPWFAWAHFFDAHQPFVAPEAFLDALDARAIAQQIAADPERWLGQSDLPPTEVVLAIAERWREYGAEIRYVDAQLGRLLAELEARGERERTVIVVVGDHGEGLTTHGEFGHGVNLYDELMHVPLVIAAPGGVDAGAGAGTRLAEPFGLVELRPLAEGLLLDGGERGGWNTLVRTGRLPSEPVFLERPHFSEQALIKRSGKRLDPYEFGSMLAVVHQGWKLLRQPSGVEVLFDLRNDPGEVHDRSQQEPELHARLAALLDEWLERHPVSDSGPVELSEERLRELEELGYLK